MLGLETVHPGEKTRKPKSSTNTANIVKKIGGLNALDRLLLDSFLDQDFQDLLPLVPLELNDFTHLLVVDDRTIARKLFLERFQEFLRVILGGYSLEGRDRFTSVALLDTNVDSVG